MRRQRWQQLRWPRRSPRGRYRLQQTPCHPRSRPFNFCRPLHTFHNRRVALKIIKIGVLKSARRSYLRTRMKACRGTLACTYGHPALWSGAVPSRSNSTTAPRPWDRLFSQPFSGTTIDVLSVDRWVRVRDATENVELDHAVESSIPLTTEAIPLVRSATRSALAPHSGTTSTSQTPCHLTAPPLCSHSPRRLDDRPGHSPATPSFCGPDSTVGAGSERLREASGSSVC